MKLFNMYREERRHRQSHIANTQKKQVQLLFTELFIISLCHYNFADLLLCLFTIVSC